MPLSYFQGLTHSATGELVLRRHHGRPVPHRPRSAPERGQPRRALARPRGPGLQPHRRPDVGRARGRAPAAAAGVLRPRRAQRRQHLRARRDRGGRPRHPEAALRRGARPGRHPQGDVGRGQPRRLRSCGRRAATTCWPTTPPRWRRAPRCRCARSGALVGAVPPSGVTGAAFYRGRLLPGRPGRRDAAAVVDRRDRRDGAGARARAAGRGRGVRGPRRPRRARRAPALAAVAVRAGRQGADVRDGPQRALDLRPRRRRPAAGCASRRPTWWPAERRASPSR